MTTIIECKHEGGNNADLGTWSKIMKKIKWGKIDCCTQHPYVIYETDNYGGYAREIASYSSRRGARMNAVIFRCILRRKTGEWIKKMTRYASSFHYIDPETWK